LGITKTHSQHAWQTCSPVRRELDNPAILLQIFFRSKTVKGYWH
jgi:hypothetical protein